MIVAGLDLGQSIDHAALVMARARGNPLAVEIGYICQWPIRTSYALIVGEVAKAVNAIGDVDLSVDARGPGKPVVDQLAGMPGLRVRRLLAISNTSGKGARREAHRPQDPAFLERWSVPKALLFRALLTLINSDRFSIKPELPQAPILKSEFEHFGFKATETGYLKLDGVGRHDDVLLATVMAVWTALTAGNLKIGGPENGL